MLHFSTFHSKVMLSFSSKPVFKAVVPLLTVLSLAACSQKDTAKTNSKQPPQDAAQQAITREVRDPVLHHQFGGVGTRGNRLQDRNLDLSTPDFAGLEKTLPSSLVSIGEVGEEENQFFQKALQIFSENPESTQALEDYVEKYPEGAYALSVRNSLSSIYYSQGRLSEVLDNAKAAWLRGSNSENSTAQYLADAAYASYSRSLAFFGLRAELRELVESVQDRAPASFASLAFVQARESLVSMEQNTESSHLCGPHALFCISQLRGDENPLAPLESPKAVSSERGMNFAQVQEIATDLGMNLVVAKANNARDVPVPSVISWERGHFSAVIERLPSGKLKVQDTMFSQPLLVEPEVLLAESSGYFMISQDALSLEWQEATLAEAESVWGAHTPAVPANGDNDDDGDCNTGMAGWSVDKLHIDLGISDTPLVYEPAFGPSIAPRISYRYFASLQDPAFNHANLGLRWNLNWISFVEDNPTQPEAAVIEQQPNNGGFRTHQQVVDATAEDGMRFVRDQRRLTQMQRTGESSYRILNNDGSMSIYDVSDGGATRRRIYCSSYIDPQGNAIQYHYDDQLRLTALTDATGKQTTLSYEHEDPLKITAITDPFGRSATFEYNDAGYLAEITDVIGIESKFNYDFTGFIDILTTPYGDTTFFAETTGQTREMLIGLPNGDRTRYKHYLFGGPSNVSNVLTPEETLPAEFGIPTSGHTQSSTYYWDRKAMKYHPDDASKAVQYQFLRQNSGFFSVSNVIRSINPPLENRIFYLYPGQTSSLVEGTLDRPSSTIQALPDGEVAVTRTEYNDLGKPTKVTDPLGRISLFEYSEDGIDLLTAKQQVGDDPSDTETLLSIEGYQTHLPTATRDASGQLTTTTYNDRGQTTSTTDALGRTVSYDYFENSTAPAYGRLQKVTAIQPDNVSTFTYDALERVATSIAPDGYTTSYTYDAFDRPLTMTYEDGTQSSYEYRHLDLAKMTDREGRTMTYNYDALRQLISEQDSEGRLKLYHWCTCGGLETLTDALGRVTKWTRDLQGRVQKKTLPDGRAYSYEYDLAGRQISMTDPKGQSRLWNYNVDGTTASMSYENALIPTEGASFTFDPHYLRPQSLTDKYGTTTFSYVPYDGSSNGAGSLASVDGPWENDTLTTTYDILGRTTAYSFPGSGGSMVYDALGRVQSSTNVLGTRSFTYDGVTSRMLSSLSSSGHATQYSYYEKEEDFRLRQIRHLHTPASGTSAGQENDISSFGYEYSATGRITAWDRQLSPSINPDRYEFGYDRVDQLISATLTDKATAAIKASYHYSYDATGNRTSFRENDVLRQHSFNVANQQLTGSAGGETRVEGTVNQATSSITVGDKPAFVGSNGRFLADITLQPGTNRIPLIVTEVDGTVTQKTMEIHIEDSRQLAYVYDLNGNLEKVTPTENLNAPIRRYTWDAADRLISITQFKEDDTLLHSVFGYNSANERVEIREYTGTATPSTTASFTDPENPQNLTLTSHYRYIWSGHRISQKRDATGNTVHSTYTGDGQYDTGNLGENGGSARKLYYTKDHLGSIRNVYTDTGEELASFDYSPFGKRTLVSGTGAGVDGEEIEFGYTGHHYHAPSKTILTLYRAYDPNLGRWLSPDPLGESVNAQGNLYNYVSNNPLNYWDPLGLDSADNLIDAMINQANGVEHLPDIIARQRLGAIFMLTAKNHFGDDDGSGDVSGFRDDLVDNGQGSQVIRHILGQAGGEIMGGLGKIVADNQAAENIEQAKTRKESETEVRDDIAGVSVGKAIKEFLEGNISEDDLRKMLEDIIKGEECN